MTPDARKSPEPPAADAWFRRTLESIDIPDHHREESREAHRNRPVVPEIQRRRKGSLPREA